MQVINKKMKALFIYIVIVMMEVDPVHVYARARACKEKCTVDCQIRDELHNDNKWALGLIPQEAPI